MTTTSTSAHRPIHVIAAEIKKLWIEEQYKAKKFNPWQKKYYGAVPYLQAMFSLTDKHSMYIADDATSVVLYFLSNVTAWKGEDAKRIKDELKAIVK